MEEDYNKNDADYQKHEFNCENDNSNENGLSSPEVMIESGVVIDTIEVNREEKVGEEEEEQQESVDLSWPKTFYKRCVFLFLAPIMFPLAYTLPDVKREVCNNLEVNRKSKTNRSSQGCAKMKKKSLDRVFPWSISCTFRSLFRIIIFDIG